MHTHTHIHKKHKITFYCKMQTRFHQRAYSHTCTHAYIYSCTQSHTQTSAYKQLCTLSRMSLRTRMHMNAAQTYSHTTPYNVHTIHICTLTHTHTHTHTHMHYTHLNALVHLHFITVHTYTHAHMYKN